MATILSTSSPQTDFSAEYDKYIMSSTNEVAKIHKQGRSLIYTFTDGTQWVRLTSKCEDRFCGFLYLQNALKEADINLKAASNKLAIHKREIIYLSQYCGDTKPDPTILNPNYKRLRNEVGFTDMSGLNNIRQVGNEIFVFDTEKDSFSPTVHEKINTFVQQHDLIRSVLEDSIKKEKKDK